MESEPPYGAASNPAARPLVNQPQLEALAGHAARLGLAGVLLLPALAGAWLGRYSRFTDDAYCQATLQHTYGAVGMVVRLYQVWSGRFAGGFFDGLEAGTLGPAWQPLWPALILLAWLAAFWWLLALAFPQRRWLPAILAGAILSALVGALPDRNDALYWSTGMFYHLPPLFLATVFAGVVVARVRRAAGHWLPSGLDVGVLMFVAGGFNETASLVMGAALVAAVPLAWWGLPRAQRRTAVPLLVGGCVGLGLALLVDWLAPGNAARQGTFVPTSDPLALALLTTQSATAALSLIAGAAPAALAGVLLVALLLGNRVRPAAPEQTWALLLVVPLLTYALLWLASLPSAYVMSSAVPLGRTMSVHTFVLVVGVAATGWLLGQLLTTMPRPGRAVLLVVCGGLALSVTAQVLQDQDRLARYAAAWDATHAAIVAAVAQGETQIQIAPPKLTSQGDIIVAESWVIPCMSDYYGINIVVPGQGLTPSVSHWD